MEFRLPEQLANKLVDYDQTLKQIKPKKEPREAGARLKRKTKLAFPCPDIFFDLTVEKIYEIYEELCFRSASSRYYVVDIRYLIAWDKCLHSKIEHWYCWKIGNKECPIILRHWYESLDDTEYKEFRADTSLKHFKTAKENPFTIRYKVERERFDAFDSFIRSVNAQLELPHPPESSGIRTQLGLYAESKFFYQQHFDVKDKESFYPAEWLANQKLYTLTEEGFNLKTNSTIVNSKFYQNEVRKEAETLKQNILTERVHTERILHKLSYIYLFLTIFPDEYDRSIHLYNQFAEYEFSTYWSTWGVFYKLQCIRPGFKGEFMEWFRSKVTPQMFANWILEEIEIKQKRDYDTPIRDTIDMLIQVKQCVTSNPEYLKEPKRWRLQEVHDHYVGITLQMDNQLKNLPMDLIPSPVNFETEVGSIRMFQPSTNHEVIRWGKAVRNCVGSAGYDDRVLEHKAFLVFAERNRKPWLTSLLTLNMGMLHIGQTVSPFNRNLELGERQVYERCLQQALGIKEE